MSVLCLIFTCSFYSTVALTVSACAHAHTARDYCHVTITTVLPSSLPQPFFSFFSLATCSLFLISYQSRVSSHLKNHVFFISSLTFILLLVSAQRSPAGKAKRTSCTQYLTCCLVYSRRAQWKLTIRHLHAQFYSSCSSLLLLFLSLSLSLSLAAAFLEASCFTLITRDHNH